MELTWLGTAGFQIKTGKHVFLIDPHLSRNAAARPKQPFAPEDLPETDHIFVSHGHFGSAGSTPEELERLSKQNIDILFVPLQGHTRICDIALRYVQALKPRMVIAHHQDDFFPPISTYVDILPFIKAVSRTCPETKIRILQINETVAI